MGITPKDLVHHKLNEQIKTLLRSTETTLNSGVPEREQALLCDPSLSNVRDLLADFELVPKQLDPFLLQHVDLLSKIFLKVAPGSSMATRCSMCFYQLCIIRNYKHVVNFLSDDISLGVPLVKRIQDSRIGEYETYFLLLWLSSLVMVPLPLEGIMSGLPKLLLDVAMENLTKFGSASMTQKISAVLLSRLLLRSDCSDMLVSYISSCCDWWHDRNYSEKLGHLMAIKLILKQSSNPTVANYTLEIYNRIILTDLLLIKYHKNSLIPNTNTLYIMGILSRLSRFNLQQADYSSVSAIVNNYINDILNPMSGRLDISLRESMAKCLSKIVSFLQLKAVNYAEQLTWYLTKQLRIPEFESQTTKYNPFVTINSSNLSVAKFHTALLFYGFLGLDRAIPVSFVPALLSVAHRTLFISSTQFSIIQNSQIRDASCFFLWALFRSLSQDDFRELMSNRTMIHDIWADILRVLICDEDPLIRRCAVPVLQEFIGRFGPLLAQITRGKDSRRLVEQTASLVDTERALNGSEFVNYGYPALLVIPTIMDVLTSSNVRFAYYNRCSQLLLELLSARSTLEVAFETSMADVDYQEALLEALKNGNSLALLPLGGLLRCNWGVEKVRLRVQPDLALVLLHHAEFVHRVSYFYWYSSCITSQNDYCDAENAFWALYLPVIANETATKGEIKDVVILSLEATELLQVPTEIFEDICKRLKFGNLQIASMLPWCAFNMAQKEHVLQMISDKSVDAETRAALIENCSYLTVTSSFKLPWQTLLDDYTLTNKGDVGLKVRLACLKHQLEKPSLELKNVGYRSKLVRLAAESMDNVRILAYALLTGEDILTLRSITYDEYFSRLFSAYSTLEEELRAPFWEGLVHSVAGLKVSKALVNLAFRQCLVWFDGVLASIKEEALSILLRQLKLPKPFAQLDHRHQKTLLATLNLFVKLFEAAVELPQFNHSALFVRTYNLQLNAPVTRSALALQIFHHLSVIPSEVTQKARQRVCQLSFQASNPQIRRLAGDSLFEIINDLAPSKLSLLEYTDGYYKPTQSNCKILESQLSCI